MNYFSKSQTLLSEQNSYSLFCDFPGAHDVFVDFFDGLFYFIQTKNRIIQALV